MFQNGSIKMDKKLEELYTQCLSELKIIGIDLNSKEIGSIDIKLSNRSKKRYGCCKQEEPDKNYLIKKKIGRRTIIECNRFKKHHIEISSWVMELDEKIIKNTIIHELIHCIPYCNNHGNEFKKYANYINEKLGYNISRLGDKKQDFILSNKEYNEKEIRYNYEIICQKCGQKVYRQRVNKNFTRKYRCGKCGGKFKVTQINNQK